jgi:hypothetical protein
MEVFAVGFEGLLFRHEEGGLLHVAGRFFIKRKGHLFYSLAFIPPLNERGCFWIFLVPILLLIFLRVGYILT